MTRRSYVQIDGVLYERGTEPKRDTLRGPTIMPDLPDFVSPIDGSVVHGRTGLRDHCARHNVVPTADLKGLPTRKPAVLPNREEIKRTIGEIMDAKGFQRGY